MQYKHFGKSIGIVASCSLNDTLGIQFLIIISIKTVIFCLNPYR